MTEKPEASVLTAKRAAQHFRLSSADDACEHLYILNVRSSLGPSPPHAGRYTVASRFRRRSCERGYFFPRAPEQFVTSPLCLVGYVRWDARSDRVPPRQTIIFSSFPGRTKGGRPPARKPLSRSTCFDFPDDLRNNNATCFARRMAGPIESSTNARVMDPLDRSSRCSGRFFPKMGYARRLRADVVT